MFDGLFIVSLVGTCVQAIKEYLEKSISAENWTNKELNHKDIMNGVPIEQCMKNLENGKYKLTETYPEPHRDKSGKIVIENGKLYNDDLMKYGAVQVGQWIKQGRYNLSHNELEKERERVKAEIEKLYSL